MLDEILKYSLLLIPIAVIQVGLMIAALVHAITHPKYKIGNKVIWVLVIILVNLIGPVLYFIIGRGDTEAGDEDDEDEDSKS